MTSYLNILPIKIFFLHKTTDKNKDKNKAWKIKWIECHTNLIKMKERKKSYMLHHQSCGLIEGQVGWERT